MSKNVIQAEEINLRKYYNVNQFRTDCWSRLKEQTDTIAQLSSNDKSLKGLVDTVQDMLDQLELIEKYWAFPGNMQLMQLRDMLNRREYVAFSNNVSEMVRGLVSNSYFHRDLDEHGQLEHSKKDTENQRINKDKRHYFEVLFVDDISLEEEVELRAKLAEVRSEKDEFIYDVIVARTFQDALITLMFNYNIQGCVIRYGFPFHAENDLKAVKQFVDGILKQHSKSSVGSDIGARLGELIKYYRPELDLYFVTDLSLDILPENVYRNFRRIFYRQEDFQELHLSVLRGISERYETPFFTALKQYSQRPTGVFHAMPISRGNSIFKSNWIREMGEFYGRNIFLAETSATTGGLDSLLQPTGPLKKAQALAARAFGSRHTYFVTNGTSTANKIVLQALIHPGDVVLIDRDCHKSHHYAMVLSGAHPVYLDSFPIEKYSMYGAVPLEEIKHKLLSFKKAGRLDKVKMLVLTNCTFDGMVYNVQRVMEEILAIKPDMIFLWDEAWFGFANFSAIYRQRTGMHVADQLYKKFQTAEYKAEYKEHVKNLGKGEISRMPHPDKVKVRVFSTQSTHKTLTSLRQGSMIHVYDEDFKMKVERSFHEAYMTHTSTSPSYQILASLDVGRMQTELEGKELVEKSVERAMQLRVRIANTPLLKKYFDILTVEDLIPENYRPSGLKRYYNARRGWSNWDDAWEGDEFTLDPTKINLYIGKTGIDGDTFKTRFLMDQFGIQVNKTSRNTVLFMTNIGTTRSSVAYLVGVLMKIAQQIEDMKESLNKEEQRLQLKKQHALTEELPALPDFSYFHPIFRSHTDTGEGDMRSAYFMAYDESCCEYIRLDSCEKVMDDGRSIVSASFVIPYPPGFPILVPGQVITKEILEFMQALDVTEIHSYNPELGFRVFSEESIKNREQAKITEEAIV